MSYETGYHGNKKLIVKDLEPFAAQVRQSDESTLTEIIAGVGPLPSQADTILSAGIARSENGVIAIKDTKEAEEWLRNRIIEIESQVGTQPAWQRDNRNASMIQSLAGDWHGLRSAHKEVFSSTLRNKEDFEGLDNTKKRKLLDFLLDSQGKRLVNFEGIESLSVGRYHNSQTIFISDKSLQAALKSLRVEEHELQTADTTEKISLAYGAVDEAAKKLIVLDAGNAPEKIILQKRQDDTWLIIKACSNADILEVKNAKNVEELRKEVNPFITKTEKLPSRYHRFSFEYAENKSERVAFMTFLKSWPLQEKLILSGLSDYSSAAALKRRAQELNIPGRSTMSEDALLEAIISKSISDNPVEKINPDGESAFFLRPHNPSSHRQARRYGGINDRDESLLPAPVQTETNNDPSTLETVIVQSVNIQSRNDQSRNRGVEKEPIISGYANTEVTAIPSRIPRGKPNSWRNSDSSKPLEVVNFPDVFAKPNNSKGKKKN